ncbi:MAG: DNA repair protein RadA [Acidimicrobiales bacterium]|nr:DNA repair protein RadA [Acidimicrobiales bacterium]
MAKTRTQHVCNECGASSPTWVGRCPGCEAWGTLVEEIVAPTSGGSTARLGSSASPVPIGAVATDEWQALPTMIGELDRVLGGGLVPGSVTLIGGEPGVGKSTLLLQLVASYAKRSRRSLYVTAEESAPQVHQRAERLGLLHEQLFVVPETVLPHVLAHIEEVKPEVVVVDSIQTVHDPALTSAPGSVSQVRHAAHHLVGLAKRLGVAVVLVGHVTKDGSLAGPRVLEHVVDTVLDFEGDRQQGLRMLRPVKHRFGATSELGLFEMGDTGLRDVPDPSELFLADRVRDVAGSVVVPTVEGHRPVLVEIQALVSNSSLASPRRSVQGVDPGRLAMLLAVLQQRLRLFEARSDVYALAVGGARVLEPGADLGLALAVVSSLTNRALPDSLVVCGEVGLAGEVRRVAHLERRLREAARLGFTQAIVPPSDVEAPVGLKLTTVASLGEAIARTGVAASVHPI